MPQICIDLFFDRNGHCREIYKKVNKSDHFHHFWPIFATFWDQFSLACKHFQSHQSPNVVTLIPQCQDKKSTYTSKFSSFIKFRKSTIFRVFGKHPHWFWKRRFFRLQLLSLFMMTVELLRLLSHKLDRDRPYLLKTNKSWSCEILTLKRIIESLFFDSHWSVLSYQN